MAEDDKMQNFPKQGKEQPAYKGSQSQAPAKYGDFGDQSDDSYEKYDEDEYVKGLVRDMNAERVERRNKNRMMLDAGQRNAEWAAGGYK